jgi:glycerophosphoryl diester phosphodiesterase
MGAAPLVLGHRGASREAPENTLAAFRLAMAQGADGVELDVWRCRSGEAVVFHDLDCQRIAGSPLRITGARWGELRALDAGLHKGEKYRGERIPLLEQVFEALPSALVNVELKSPGLGRGDPRLAWEVARLIAAGGAADRVIVSSFDPVLLGLFRLAAPRIPTGLLFEAAQRWRLVADVAAPALWPAALHPEAVLVTPERARAWKRRGYALNVWTVDAPGEVDRLCGIGVDGLITNVPGEVAPRVKGHPQGA